MRLGKTLGMGLNNIDEQLHGLGPLVVPGTPASRRVKPCLPSEPNSLDGCGVVMQEFFTGNYSRWRDCDILLR